jgi:hypothetical protein
MVPWNTFLLVFVTATPPTVTVAAVLNAGPVGVLGSSNSNRTSDSFVVAFRMRLVIVVLPRNTARFAKLAEPAGRVPLHCSTMSPANSVNPSDRISVGTAAVALQVKGCALAVETKPVSRATTANARIHLRKSAILFSLWNLRN